MRLIFVVISSLIIIAFSSCSSDDDHKVVELIKAEGLPLYDYDLNKIPPFEWEDMYVEPIQIDRKEQLDRFFSKYDEPINGDLTKIDFEKHTLILALTFSPYKNVKIEHYFEELNNTTPPPSYLYELRLIESGASSMKETRGFYTGIITPKLPKGAYIHFSRMRRDG